MKAVTNFASPCILILSFSNPIRGLRIVYLSVEKHKQQVIRRNLPFGAHIP